MLGLSIMASMYSIFLPFFQNLWDLTDYNIAYYGANSSIERAMLTTKYQEPWFEWSWWRLNHNSRWPPSDAEFNGFSRFNYNQNGIYRNVSSRTTTIPKSWEWNIPYLLADADSKEYNILSYQDIEKFILSVDNTNNVNDFYRKDSNINTFGWTSAEGTIRIPPKVYKKFGDNNNALLCDDENNNDCDINQDKIYNEKIITRWLDWTYDPLWNNIKFKIIPKTAIFYNLDPNKVDILFDNNFREDSINSAISPNIIFSNSLSKKFNPITKNNSISLISWHNTIAENPDIIKNLSFWNILSNSYSNISIGINYLLQSRNQQIYPFLEYKFNFDSEVSDRFFSINWYGKVWNYNVNIIVKKPTYKKTTAWDFTIIF